MPNTIHPLPNKYTRNHREALRKIITSDPININKKVAEMASNASRNGYISAIPFAIFAVFVILGTLDQTYLNSTFTNSSFANSLGITNLLNNSELIPIILSSLLAPSVIYMVAEQVRIQMTIRAMKKEAEESHKSSEEKHKDSEEKKKNLQSEAAKYNFEELNNALKNAIGQGEQLADLFSLSIILGAAKTNIVKKILEQDDFKIIKNATAANDAALVITLINGSKETLNLPQETNVFLKNMVRATLLKNVNDPTNKEDDKRYQCVITQRLIDDPVKVRSYKNEYHYIARSEYETRYNKNVPNLGFLKSDNILPCDEEYIKQIEFLNIVKENPIQLFKQLVAMGEIDLAKEFLENRGKLLEISEDQRAEIKEMLLQGSKEKTKENTGVAQASATALSRPVVAKEVWVD